jgi:hypothetical protein
MLRVIEEFFWSILFNNFSIRHKHNSVSNLTSKAPLVLGYEFEIRECVETILANRSTDINLLSQAADSLAIIEAEKISLRHCSVVPLKLDA